MKETLAAEFVNLQKAFDTVEHQILLTKLNHYGIHGIFNDWFKSYLSNRNQYVSITAHDSDLAAVNCGVPQGCLRAPILKKNLRLQQAKSFAMFINIFIGKKISKNI